MSALPQVEVVVAGPDDWRTVRELRLAALADTPDAFGATLDEEDRQPDAFWRDRLAPDARSTTLVASLVPPAGSEAARPAGLAVVGPSFDGPAEVAGLYSVWVVPAYRGCGVGDALLRAACGQARRTGYRRLVLDVGDHNTAAQALYARHGLTPTGRTSTLPAPRAHVTEHELTVDL